MAHGPQLPEPKNRDRREVFRGEEREGIVRRDADREDFDHRFLLSVVKRDLPAGFYQPPADYRAVPFQTNKWIDLRQGPAQSR
jgi:hypothetical protein